MTTVLEGLAVVLGADERLRQLTRDVSDIKRKFADAMEHIIALEVKLAENDIDTIDRPYSIER